VDTLIIMKKKSKRTASKQKYKVHFQIFGLEPK